MRKSFEHQLSWYSIAATAYTELTMAAETHLLRHYTFSLSLPVSFFLSLDDTIPDIAGIPSSN